MTPAEAVALAVLARASIRVAGQGAPLPLDADEAHAVRALEQLHLVQVEGDRVVATPYAEQRLDATRAVLLEGLDAALRVTRGEA